MRKELETLLVDSRDLELLGRRLATFNILRVLRFEHGELRHSNVLAWLLTPDEAHGLGDRFLRRWLLRVLHESGANCPIRVLDLATAELRNVTVHREWGRIDLVVRIDVDGADWVIAIENKLHSVQSDGQLARYARSLESAFPGAKRLLLFLTLHEEAGEHEEWVDTSYALVRDVLQACRDERRAEMGAEPGVLVDHYLQTLRALTMPDDDLVKLAQRIYLQHRRALDYVYANIEDEVAVVSEALEKLMRDAAARASITPLASVKGFTRFIPAGWDAPANRAGHAWGQTESAYLLCEIAWNRGKPRLKVVESRSPDVWRRDLYELARKNKAVLRAPSKQPAQWMTVYSEIIPPRPDDQPDEAAQKAWAFVENHIRESKKFASASKLLAAHLEKLPPPG